MKRNYFDRVHAETQTRLWINNPSAAELDLALAAGVRNVTTNPAYCSKLFKSELAFLHSVIDEVIKNESNDEVAADLVYQKTSVRILKCLRTFYDGSEGREGFVTLQADPREDEDAEAIIAVSLRHRKLGPNYMAKIPVTRAGSQALETLIEQGVATCATEVFSVAQAIHICELYRRATGRSGKRPVFYVTHITGIFDEYLQRVVKRDGIDIAPSVLREAGCAVARKEYRLLKERGYAATMLGGGARVTEHFTEFVGGDVHITINWSTADELIRADRPVVSRIDAATPPKIIDELCEKLPDFRRAYEEDGLALDQFAGFGPVQLFRNNFIEGWYRLLAEIPARRAQLLRW